MMIAAWTSMIVVIAQAAGDNADGYILPHGASDVVPYVDNPLMFIFAVTVFFFTLIIALMVYFAIRFRRRDPHQKALTQKSHNTLLELSWTLPPLVIVIIIFFWSFTGYLRLDTPPADAYEIRVTAQKWSWLFTHPNGAMESTLHIPAETPIKLAISSRDVIHSLFIPAFRIKKDAVPNRYNYIWFTADAPTPLADAPLPEDPDALATFERQQQESGHILFCTEYCGTQHSTMVTRVIVHEKGWRPPKPDESAGPTAELGRKLYRSLCISCHTLDGSANQGPSFKGIFGRQQQMTTGQTITVDENYLRESIINPQAKIVQGYQNIVMPAFSYLSDTQIDSLVLFLKELKAE